MLILIIFINTFNLIMFILTGLLSIIILNNSKNIKNRIDNKHNIKMNIYKIYLISAFFMYLSVYFIFNFFHKTFFGIIIN